LWKKLENIHNSVHDMILIACIFTSTAEDIKITTHALCARIFLQSPEMPGAFKDVLYVCFSLS
jgi:hypothetical protein